MNTFDATDVTSNNLHLSSCYASSSILIQLKSQVDYYYYGLDVILYSEAQEIEKTRKGLQNLTKNLTGRPQSLKVNFYIME